MVNIETTLGGQSAQLANIEGGLQSASTHILQTLSGNAKARFNLIDAANDEMENEWDELAWMRSRNQQISSGTLVMHVAYPSNPNYGFGRFANLRTSTMARAVFGL